MYILLRLEMNHLSIEAKQDILKSLNIMPFKYRIFYRFSLFSHKILNKFFLPNISKLLKPVEKIVNASNHSKKIFYHSTCSFAKWFETNFSCFNNYDK